MSRSIADLREHLFATLDALRDKDAPMELDRAKAVAEVAQTIINSAKVEVDYLRATGNGNAASEFIDGKPKLPPGVLGIKTHRLAG